MPAITTQTNGDATVLERCSQVGNAGARDGPNVCKQNAIIESRDFWLPVPHCFPCFMDWNY